MKNSLLLPGHLFSPVTGEIDTIQLQNLVEAHPYCASAQFYLLHTAKATPDVNTSSQSGKAALFFNNKHWLTWQLHKAEIQAKSWREGTVADTESLVPFEPLHAVDYFASQGITIRQEAGSDKLGKQLKSFTEWLKTMKKIQADPTAQGNEITDQNIQTIAEGSNALPEVVTEAMAEVLEKQGKPGKAIEIYNKLSLTDRSKSAYFAAKIDSLKGL